MSHATNHSHNLKGALSLLEELDTEVSQKEVEDKVKVLKQCAATAKEKNKSKRVGSEIPGMSPDCVRQLKKQKEKQEHLLQLQEYVKVYQEGAEKVKSTKISL
eukprot:symbB.v1.2.004435.t1/scaffold251.1/size321111/4